MGRSSTVATDQLRTAVRFSLRLALQVKTPTGIIHAVTENISANGILFTAKNVPPVSSRIEFTIKMPAEVMGTMEDVMVQCVGRVVRHQQNGDEAQAAAIIDEYVMRA